MAQTRNRMATWLGRHNNYRDSNFRENDFVAKALNWGPDSFSDVNPTLTAGRDQRHRRPRPWELPLPRLPRLLHAAHLPPQPAAAHTPATRAAIGPCPFGLVWRGPIDSVGALDRSLTGGHGRGSRRGQGRGDRGRVVPLDRGDGGGRSCRVPGGIRPDPGTVIHGHTWSYNTGSGSGFVGWLCR